MGLTAEKVHVEHGVGIVRATLDVTFDTGYVTGGEDLAPVLAAANHGRAPSLTDASQLTSWRCEELVAGHRAVVDRTNGKLKLYTSGTTEAGNGTDQSAITVRLTLEWGRWVR